MDTNTALVLRCILAHAPCTKLCLKQHSGLSMSAVLRAVDELHAAGWIALSTYQVPQGGKPHTRIEVGKRAVYGAVPLAVGWQVCALSLPGVAHADWYPTLPDEARPVTVITRPTQGEDEAEDDGDDAADTTPIGDIIYMPQGQARACYLACHGGELYIDEHLTLYRAEGAVGALGALPSPMLADKRLGYGEAFARCDATQKNRLTAELTMFIQCISGAKKVCFAGESPMPDDAEAAAWAGLNRLLWPTCDKARPH